MSPPQPPEQTVTSKISYKDAGVDIDAKEDLLKRARGAIRKSFTPGVLGDIGLFGGLFDPARVGFADAILVATADGVGTKLEVARRARVYDTVGWDLVNHCINDALVQGARPLFFLDYVAMGKLDPDVVGALITGCAEACRASGLALIGGETAEMPGVYKEGDFELAGFLVGAVRREHLLDGSRVRPGQILLGLGSSGLHTNGYSLARRVLFDRLGLGLSARPPELGGRTLQEALLAVHRPYLAPLWPLIERGRLAAMAHITGGGLPGNVNRVLGSCDALIDRESWRPSGLFELIVRGGELDADEAYRALNMGIGMVLFVEPADLDVVEGALAGVGEKTYRIGRTVAGRGEVRWGKP